MSGVVFSSRITFLLGKGGQYGVEKKQSVTANGLKRFQEELDDLKSVKRKEVIERIKSSRCFGLIENSDYETAREDQGFIEGRILALETIIRNAVIINNSNLVMSSIQVGNTVKIQEIPDGEYETYTIVGSAEADPLEGRISNDSPIAKCILGLHVGEEVNVQTPDGKLTILIVSID